MFNGSFHVSLSVTMLYIVKIIVPPVDQTVAVNSVASFFCVVEESLGWHIKLPHQNSDGYLDYQNDQYRPSLNARGIRVGSEPGYLLVDATRVNNSTLVKCRDTSRDLRNRESKPAILLVFGKRCISIHTVRNRLFPQQPPPYSRSQEEVVVRTCIDNSCSHIIKIAASDSS